MKYALYYIMIRTLISKYKANKYTEQINFSIRFLFLLRIIKCDLTSGLLLGLPSVSHLSISKFE